MSAPMTNEEALAVLDRQLDELYNRYGPTSQAGAYELLRKARAHFATQGERFSKLSAKLIHLPRYFNALPETKWPGWVMEPHKDGEWVQFSEVSAAILDVANGGAA